jgi:beta-glucosidase
MYDGVENLFNQMTLQEKVLMLAGTNGWYTTPVERLGIPSLKRTDGPNGARDAGGFTSGVQATCFPAEIALAFLKGVPRNEACFEE